MSSKKYYTAKEVASHNAPEDCWVSLLGQVYDITPLIKQYQESPLAIPLINIAGEDISHWFDPTTKDVKKFIDPVTNLETYYTPMGRFIHVPPRQGSSAIENFNFDTPWWKDAKYVVGLLSKKTRHVRIVNMLTRDDHILEVCEEETVKDIQQRYLTYNKHATSYTWKRLGRVLEMNKTLEENGITNEDAEFEELGIADGFYTPAINIYYNDDLTSA